MHCTTTIKHQDLTLETTEIKQTVIGISYKHQMNIHDVNRTKRNC